MSLQLAAADDLHQRRRYAEAVPLYRAAVAAAPERFEAWYGLAAALLSLQEHAEAADAFRHALTLQPDGHRVRLGLAQSLFALGHVSGAVGAYEQVIAGNDAEAAAMAIANVAQIVPGDPAADNARILAARMRWAAQEARAVPVQAPARPAPGAKLRLGYYGTFFADPNWMKMYMGVINAHDRDRFEINLIVDGADPCESAGYRGHDNDRIWDVTGISNADLARHARDNAIDILIDLNGFSHAGRLPLLLHRAAPVQVAWNGMYGTTGLPGIDALIADPWCLPAEEETLLTEPVRRVAGTYLAFDMFYPTPPVVLPPCLEAGHITFGSLNSAYKLTDLTLDAWAAVLRAVPGSRLLLRNRGLDAPGNRAHLLARFGTIGIEAERIRLEGSGDHDAFLATYGRIDIALDSFPYNGGTTTAEALWQGVPVLTCIGDRWAGRTSRSIVMAAGLRDDVAPDIAELPTLAAALAADREALAIRRSGQRALLASSRAHDPAALCRELETIYCDLYAAAWA